MYKYEKKRFARMKDTKLVIDFVDVDIRAFLGNWMLQEFIEYT